MDALKASLAIVLLLAVPAARAAEETIAVGGETRSYLLFVPPGEAGHPRPTVILLHGGMQTPEAFAQLTRFPEFAGRHDVVAVFPRGVDRHWNDGRKNGVQSFADDVGFLRALMDSLARRGIADPGRIYVGGYSNGGMMTLRLACEAGERLAGIVAVAANQPADWTCPVQHPLPAIFMHGTDDPVMPFVGGSIELLFRNRGQVLSADATVALWQTANGCGAPAREHLASDEASGTTVEIDRYACPPGRGLEHVIVQGGGHTWPGSAQGWVMGWLLGRVTPGLDADAELWTFFSR